MCRRRYPRADCHTYVFNFGRNVLREVVEHYVLDGRPGAARAQYGLPLNEARRWRIHRLLLCQVNLLPLAPVAVRIVDIAAARRQLEAAVSAHFGAPPLGENLGVEHIALVGSF